MERILLLLDELEDLIYCLPLLWGRVRAVLRAASPPLIACAALFTLPLLASSATGFGLLLAGALFAVLPLARARRVPPAFRQRA